MHTIFTVFSQTLYTLFCYRAIDIVFDMSGEVVKQNLESLRKIRAYYILAEGDIPKMIGEKTFIVPSQEFNRKLKVNLK